MGYEARNFSTSKSYAVGDYCLRYGYLYRFTSSHSAGAWDDSDVVIADQSTEQAINRVINDIVLTTLAVAKGEKIVFEPSQITGTRYKYILTNA